MKTIVRLMVLMLCTSFAEAQITTPVIRAMFGVDGDLKANYINGMPLSGNDDWFTQTGGQWVIDTTGAAALVARYAIDPNFRQLPFYRMMRVAPYSLVNNKRWIDAVFIRDYHGNDSTMFASGSNKNGMSPAVWSCPVAQSVPDKNEILDMMVHVRREGPSTTDSLWMFGGISIESVTGNRYFDFEMYQTDIYYDRPSLRFYGYGPDAGHTSWKFDAGGNITVPGDIIFTADYSSNSLTSIEARIWVDRAALSVTPVSFNWTGSFDGANTGSQYGYAGIAPKTAGAFYTGLTCAPTTWAGPFKVVLGDNSVATDYIAGQFMEFSVNLTKLGLDPVTLLGGNACGMPFRRILVKTRSSTSFTASLKDFVGPFDFFLAPRADAKADVPILCGTASMTDVKVTNAVSTSIYTWSTPDGVIVGSNTGPTITVSAPGTYIVQQTLQSGCSTYATDTVTLAWDPLCNVLASRITDFSGNFRSGNVQLNWTVSQNKETSAFEIERSTDGLHFGPVSRVSPQTGLETASYTTTDDVHGTMAPAVYYRLKIINNQGYITYSRTLRIVLNKGGETVVTIAPNPVKDVMQLYIAANAGKRVQVFIYDITGQLMLTRQSLVQKGISTISITGFDKWQKGIYAVKVLLDDETFVEKIVLTK